ncbi:MAG: tetratricopeptide repeat protein, partial [Alphaproteobacteria bacterium]
MNFEFNQSVAARRTLAAIVAIGLIGIGLTGAGSAWGQAKKPDQRDAPMSTLGAYLSGAYGETKSDFAWASQALARALQADPDNPELQTRLLASYIADGRIESALTVAKKIAEHSPNDELANLTLGTDAARRKDFKAARAAFGRIGRDGPNALIMPLVMAWVEMGLGDANKAIEAMKPLDALSGVGNFQDMHAGFILELAGKKAEAEKHFRAAYERTSPPSLRIADALATFYWKQNRKDDARKI